MPKQWCAVFITGLSVLVSGCSGSADMEDAGLGDGSTRDAGSDVDAAMPCASDEECDDGAFCNGAEVCADGVCEAGEAPDCDDGIACTVDTCSEVRRECLNDAPDADEDGVADAACLGGDGLPLGRDCDDSDPNRFPGNPEVCDESHDEDCDPSTFGEEDTDADGHHAERCCNLVDGSSLCGDDCDDGNRNVYAAAPELCDDRDNDCDDTVDEELSNLSFGVDCDGDRFGVATDPPIVDCALPSEPIACPGGVWVPNVTDCDDTLASRNPGLVEVCDGIDNNCDPAMMVDEGLTFRDYYPDCDGDGHGDATATAVNACMIPPAPMCTGGVWALSNDDCNDASDVIYAGRPETCDGLDNDCDIDDAIDEGLTFLPYYPDCDGDGEGDDTATPMSLCMPPTVPPACTGGVWVVNDADCDDSDMAVNTRAMEVCDHVDNDCDGTNDVGPMGTSLRVAGRSDGDGDGVGLASRIDCAGTPGFIAGTSGPVDCNDSNPDIFPGQTAFFETPSSSSCPDPTYKNLCAGGATCGRDRPFCAVPGVCIQISTCVDTPPDTIPSTPVWNYDCNGMHDKPEFDACMCDYSSMSGPGCDGGYQSSGADCGTMVEHRTCNPTFMCSAGPPFDFCHLASTSMRVLPCR